MTYGRLNSLPFFVYVPAQVVKREVGNACFLTRGASPGAAGFGKELNPVLSDDRLIESFPQLSKTVEVCVQTIRYLSCVNEQN